MEDEQKLKEMEESLIPTSRSSENDDINILNENCSGIYIILYLIPQLNIGEILQFNEQNSYKIKRVIKIGATKNLQKRVETYKTYQGMNQLPPIMKVFKCNKSIVFEFEAFMQNQFGKMQYIVQQTKEQFLLNKEVQLETIIQDLCTIRKQYVQQKIEKSIVKKLINKH